MNRAGAHGIPFIFGVDFELTKGFFYEQPEKQQEILWYINGASNRKNIFCETDGLHNVSSFTFQPHPISMSEYTQKFDTVRKGLMRGDSFLLNLTVTTPVTMNIPLSEIFQRSTSPYRLLVPDRFVCFSPETFVKIREGVISSFPMKGTIDASVPNAEQVILNDYKEKAEHYTITDLIRNDLSRVADHVRVERFRYTDRLKTSKGEILQVSSEISGKLPENYQSRIGDIIFTLLPAGSISGAPKAATLRIIDDAEQQPRGFYTGIFGYFDGKNLDSAVMIRFIEKRGEKFFFRSGGGVTINSQCEAEYEEVLKKVYLPFR